MVIVEDKFIKELVNKRKSGRVMPLYLLQCLFVYNWTGTECSYGVDKVSFYFHFCCKTYRQLDHPVGCW